MAAAPNDEIEVETTLRAVLADVLGLDPARVAAFREETVGSPGTELEFAL